jgi:ribosomal protein S18 acetylase RimI-like enzyme
VSPADAGLARLLETADAGAARDLAAAADRATARALGIRWTTLGGATALAASHLDVLAYNRVVGLGLDRPAADPLLDRALAWFQAADVPRFFVQVSPYAAPPDLTGRLAARGLAHYNNWVKLWRPVDRPTPAADCAFRIVEAGPEHAQAFGALLARNFGIPGAAAGWLARLVGRDGWRNFVALDGGTVVATGSLFRVGDAGWMGFAATEGTSRGRGAQSALIARRIETARALELRTLVVETAEDTPDRRAPSFHNLRRLGFEPAYIRPNYLWTAPPDERPAA